MRPGIIERALELAPECTSLGHIRRKLKAEGYIRIEEHLSGRAIRTQLTGLLSPTDKKRRVR